MMINFLSDTTYHYAILLQWHPRIQYQTIIARQDMSVSFDATPYGTVTNFKYSPNGNLLAISDSEGYVLIYSRQEKGFSKAGEFRADEASIWGLAWADSRHGNLIGIGSLNKKIAIFQQTAQGWREIAFHDEDQSSVNCVEWSPCGLKLFGGRSDGRVSILELAHKQWRYSLFEASASSIVSLTFQPIPFGEIIATEQEDSFNSRIVTVSKDHQIRIWAHQSQKNYLTDVSLLNGKKPNKEGYIMIKQFSEKESIKNIIWRPSWGSIEDSMLENQLIYCTEEGNLKQLLWSNKKHNIKEIISGEKPFTRVSQSLTGNFISASNFFKDRVETLILTDKEGEWKVVKSGNL